MDDLSAVVSPYVIWGSVAVGVALATISTTRWLVPWWRATRLEIRRVCTCGHVPDPPTDNATRVMRVVARCLVWIQVGKIEVSGAENLACDAPKLITPTHGHYIDPFVLALALPEGVRCMAARGLLQFGGGLGALVFSRWGAFCTDLSPGKGGPAVAAAVRLLASGQTVMVFPEGWAHMDGDVRPFKRGAVGIARMAAVKAGRPVSIVPVFVRYGGYPGPWILKFPPPVQYLIVMLGLPFFRRGARVVVGERVPSSELSRRTATATEELRSAVMRLDPRADEMSARRDRC